MNKKLAFSILLVGLTSINITRTADVHIDAQGNANYFELFSTNNLMFAGAVALLSPYMYKYWTKEDPQTRYDLDELKQGKNFFKNLYYYFIDGFNGTPEVNESTKLKGENGKELTLEVKPRRPATGIIGKIHAAHRNIFTTAGFIAAIWALVNYKTVIKTLPILIKILRESKDSIDIVFGKA